VIDVVTLDGREFGSESIAWMALKGEGANNKISLDDVCTAYK
jgi:hypothetical protein